MRSPLSWRKHASIAETLAHVGESVCNCAQVIQSGWLTPGIHKNETSAEHVLFVRLFVWITHAENPNLWYPSLHFITPNFWSFGANIIRPHLLKGVEDISRWFYSVISRVLHNILWHCQEPNRLHKCLYMRCFYDLFEEESYQQHGPLAEMILMNGQQECFFVLNIDFG